MIITYYILDYTYVVISSLVAMTENIAPAMFF